MTTDFSTQDIRDYRWTQFTFVKDRDDDEPIHYDMLTWHQVGPDGKKMGEMYYCGTCIAYMLGHEDPYEYIQSLPERYKKAIPKNFYGVFLDEAGVRELAANNQWVLDWLDSYITRCNKVDSSAQTGFTSSETKDVECPF